MSTTFIVPGLDGITFTATYDAQDSWLRIDGHNTEGQQVSGSGFSITREPIEPITVTPEPAAPREEPTATEQP